MSLLKRLEARFGRWAIPNVTRVIIAGQVLLYVGRYMLDQQGAGRDPTAFWLLPGHVFSGEVWRLVTFVFSPPNRHPIFVIFFWILLYLFGNSLEQFWGTLRYNSFLLLGYAAMILASLAIWSWGGDAALIVAYVFGSSLTGGLFNPSVFLYSSLFFAFARVFPHFVIHVYFILPIKIQWLAMIQWLAYGYVFLRGNWPVRILVVAAITNYVVFFGRDHWRELKSRQRRRAYRARAAPKKFTHQCLVCGLNSEDSPKTSFRYCSKCSGTCCYCPEHIQAHQHVVGSEDPQTNSELADSKT